MVGQFKTTQWTQVLEAGDSSAPEARAALEELCAVYWYPLYAYVRRTGQSAEDARDLTQGFFGHMLENDLISAADPAKGRFRSFMLACMKNYLSHERDRAAALKRGGGAPTLSLDALDAETRFERESTDTLPDALFERRWALTLMERAMGALEAEYAGDPERWAALKPCLTGGARDESYRQVGERLGNSESAVRVAVHRLRKRYGELLRAQIAETVAGPDEVDAELRHLLTSIGSAGMDA